MNLKTMKSYIMARLVSVITVIAYSMPVITILTSGFNLAAVYGFVAATLIMQLSKWGIGING